MNINSKNALRKFILAKRDQYCIEDRRNWDEIIYNKFISSDYYKKSKVIFIFVSFRSEVNTHKIIIKAIEDGKTICVPRIVSKEQGMKVYRIKGLEELETGYYGVLEPSEKCEEISIKDIDLVIMPGAAFDRNGGRLGYGGGFYDRFLSKAQENLKKIALAYEFQILESVPMEGTDIRIDDVITN